MDETTSKYTPGPWKPYIGPMNMEGGLNPFFKGIVALLKHSGDSGEVAVILDRDEPAYQYEANAHLIAAAPDLYAAAQALLAIDSKPVMEEIKLLPKRMQNQVVKDHNAKVKAVLESLKAAIAKAEGRS